MIYVHAHGKGKNQDVSRIIKALRHTGDDSLRISSAIKREGNDLLLQEDGGFILINGDKLRW